MHEVHGRLEEDGRLWKEEVSALCQCRCARFGTFEQDGRKAMASAKARWFSTMCSSFTHIASTCCRYARWFVHTAAAGSWSAFRVLGGASRLRFAAFGRAKRVLYICIKVECLLAYFQGCDTNSHHAFSSDHKHARGPSLPAL